MFELGKQGNTYRIYDKENQKYVGFSKSKRLAESKLLNLQKKGFEGSVPGFFFTGNQKYGINFDKNPDF